MIQYRFSNENPTLQKENEEMSEAQTAEVTSIDPLRAVFQAGVDAEKDEDAIKFDLLNNGAKFSNVNKVFRKYSIEFGFDLSKKDRDTKIHEILNGYDLEDEEGFNALAEQLATDIPGMTAQRAPVAIRSYAKKHELAVYKRVKGTGARNGFQIMFHDWLVESTPFPTKEQAENYINENGTKNAIKRMRRLTQEWDMANRIVQKYTG